MLAARCARMLSVLVLSTMLLRCGASTGFRETDGGPIDAPRDTVGTDLGPAVCGNSVVEGTEECDEGPMNEIGHAFTVSIGGAPEQVYAPRFRTGTATLFYDYRSASAHTGLEQVGAAQLFLHIGRDDGQLALFFYAGIDIDMGGPPQPDSAMMATFVGVPTGSRLLLSDDQSELSQQFNGDYVGDWTFMQNTDGGVITNLSWTTDWIITITPTFVRGITRYRLFSNDGEIPLMLDTVVRLRHRVRGPACRPDCTRPRCGDGNLDAGERCDDGNTRSGDSCSADCQSFR